MLTSFPMLNGKPRRPWGLILKRPGKPSQSQLEKRIKTYLRRFTAAGVFADLEKRCGEWSTEDGEPFRLKVLRDCLQKNDHEGFWFNTRLLERALIGGRLTRARQSKIESGKEFREKLHGAMEFWKERHPIKFKWNSDKWLLHKFIKGAEEWKNLTPLEKEERWEDDDPTIQLIDFLAAHPRKPKTILNNISLLRKSLT